MYCDARMGANLIQGLLLWIYLLGCVFIVESLEPGFLDFDNLPDTNFSCVGKVIGGYYADLETNCQMFHVCTIGQLDEPMDIRFLCLNGTVFDQETRVCERIDEVDCSKSEQFYSLNLELYGNTQSPILEESPEVEISSETRKSSSSTTTTTTTKRPRPKTTPTPQYYTTSLAPPTTTRMSPKVITSHQFPVGTSSDIRFNPEEINISLNPGSLPSIRPSIAHSFQQTYHNDQTNQNTRVSVTTHTTAYKNDKPQRVPLLPSLFHSNNGELQKISSTPQQPKSIVSYDLTHNKPLVSTPHTEDINYDYSYQTEQNVEYHTDIPQRNNYNYNQNIVNLRPPAPNAHPYNPTRNNHFTQNNYQGASKRPFKLSFPVATTYRSHSIFSSSVKPTSQLHVIRTDKPPRLQLPLPLLPTLPPLTFSSPAPFTLGHHIETKRYTNEHQPPRIVISASASVSDNSGRRLNYSLGTIGTTQLIELPKSAFEDYKEDDMEVDAFYQDVPKIKKARQKRNAENNTRVVGNEEETADVLKLLFNWYSKQEDSTKISIPISSDDITHINQEFGSTTSKDYDYDTNYDDYSPQRQQLSSNNSNNDTNIVANVTEVTNTSESSKNETSTELPEYYDYYYDDDINTNATEKIEPSQNFEEAKNITNSNQSNFSHDLLSSIPDYVDDNYEPAVYKESNSSSTPLNLEEKITNERTNMSEIQSRKDADIVELLSIQSVEEKENDDGRITEPRGTSVKIDESLTEAAVSTTKADWTFDTNIYAFGPTGSNKYEEVVETTSLSSTVDVPNNTEATEEVGNYETTLISTESSRTTAAQIQDTIKAVEEATKSIVEMKYQSADEYSETTTPDVQTSSGYQDRENLTTTEPMDAIAEATLTTSSEELDEMLVKEIEKITTISAENVTTTPVPSSSTTDGTTNKYQYVRTKDPWRRRQEPSSRRNYNRHRFSAYDRRTEARERAKIEANVIDVLSNALSNSSTSIENLLVHSNNDTAKLSDSELVSNNSYNLTVTERSSSTEAATVKERSEAVPVTDAPLSKSANPTRAKTIALRNKSTTPLSRLVRVEYRREKVGRSYTFNCFDKKINSFYSDPRDCRLFHYCTWGYSKHQLLDMKFVCDLGTYFDDEKLICTKTKPTRCL